MNEKKFSKKLNDMTPEEKQRKDALWQKISLESGIEVGEKKVFSLRLAMTVAMCVFVLLIAIPIVVVNLNKPTHQVGTSKGHTSTNSATPDDDPNMFYDNEYIYVASTKTIEEIAKNDSNVLFVKDWKREENATSFIKAKGTDKVIGIVDKSRVVGLLNDSADKKEYDVSIKILYEDVSIESVDKAVKDMKNTDNVNGIDVLWRSGDKGGSASFVYNNYTYYIEINGGTSSGEVALNAAQTLLTSK